jgi:hypothetical protein
MIRLCTSRAGRRPPSACALPPGEGRGNRRRPPAETCQAGRLGRAWPVAGLPQTRRRRRAGGRRRRRYPPRSAPDKAQSGRLAGPAGSPARRESCAIVSACGCGVRACATACAWVCVIRCGGALSGEGEGESWGLPPPPQPGRRGCVAAKSGADRGEARGARARRGVRRADGVRMRG